MDELAAAGVDSICVAPGSRSTPLTVAAAEHEHLHVYSHLDERSMAFFALGRARATGTPVPIVTTSGTATAELHPAIQEADRARVPMLALTADRPRELADSGANQTIDQTKLYGDAVRWFRTLPDPEANSRKLRAIRTTACRAVATATRAPAGPVHLNVPFRKPLSPTIETEEVPPDFAERHPLAASGRDGPFVRITDGRKEPEPSTVDSLHEAITEATRPLVVAGPADGDTISPSVAAQLATDLEAPLVADPLSGLRFGEHVEGTPVIGAADVLAAAGVLADWPTPDFVIRVGASPTSKAFRNYLATLDTRQVLIDPAGGWREASFTATDLVAADPTATASALLEEATPGKSMWLERWRTAAAIATDVAAEPPYFEGGIARHVVSSAPAGATLFVSNSMPVRDVDRFGPPRTDPLTVYGNRGASGIDGITSTALGAGSATDDPLIVLTGDLAYYHDSNGLLALDRCDVSATIVLINNDGGGIFQKLPIAKHDTFESQFRTPHGLDFAPLGDLYDFSVRRVGDYDAFSRAYETAIESDGTNVIEVIFDATDSHEVREALCETVGSRLSDAEL